MFLFLQLLILLLFLVRYLREMYNRALADKEAFMEKSMQAIGGNVLKADGNYEWTKNVQADGVRVGNELITVMNERNQIVKQEVTQESENEHLENMMVEIRGRSKNNSQLLSTEIVYVDNCCHARSAIERGFGWDGSEGKAKNALTLSDAEMKEIRVFDSYSEMHWRSFVQMLQRKAEKRRLFGALNFDGRSRVTLRVVSSLINVEESVIADGVVISTDTDTKRAAEIIENIQETLHTVHWFTASQSFGNSNILCWGWRMGVLATDATTIEHACINVLGVRCPGQILSIFFLSLKIAVELRKELLFILFKL